MNIMTREEILAMEPGRELDVLVAEKVMELRVYHYDKDIKENCYYMLMDNEFFPFEPFGGEKETEEEAWLSCSYYSTDIYAAWEVVEKMRLIVAPNNNGGWKAGRMDGARLEKHHVIWSDRWSFAQTAPEAICKAALLAILPGEE